MEHEDGNKYITLEVCLPASHDYKRQRCILPLYMCCQQSLQARKLAPNMDRFLYNVAGAENMTFNTHK